MWAIPGEDVQQQYKPKDGTNPQFPGQESDMTDESCTAERKSEIHVTIGVKYQIKSPFKVRSCINLTAEQRAEGIREVVRANTIMLQIKQQAGELKEKAAAIAEFKQSNLGGYYCITLLIKRL